MFKIDILGPLSLNSYNMPILVGIFIAFYLINFNKKLYEVISYDNFVDLISYGAIVGILGARLLYILTEEKTFSFINFLRIWEGGLSVLGAVISAVVFVITFCLYKNINFLSVLDESLVYLPIVHGFGRIGCFLTGCCFGKTTDMYNLIGLDKHPSQLYSAAIFFLIFICLLKISEFKKPGLVLFSYMFLICLERIFVDYFRADRSFFSNISFLSVNQVIAVAILISIFLGLFLYKNFYRIYYDRYF